MKRSEILVSMPMTTYDEFEEFKKKYRDLRDSIGACLKPSVDDGIDYMFDVEQALNIAKSIFRISDSKNIEVFYTKKIGGK